jgi:hypothetical protein
MKTLYYTILLFALTISSCTSDKPLETLSYENEPAKTISEFLKWYKENNEKVNAIQLINNPLPDDTGSYYTVNYDSTQKYILTLSKSGYLSDNYLNTLNEHFKSSDKELTRTKQNDGPPFGFDYDYIMDSQDFESELDSVKKNTHIVSMSIEKESGYVLIDFHQGYRREFYLSKVNNKWLIDRIGIKS